MKISAMRTCPARLIGKTPGPWAPLERKPDGTPKLALIDVDHREAPLQRGYKERIHWGPLGRSRCQTPL